MGKIVCILSVILLTFVFRSRADITAIACTVGDATDGDTKCQDQDSNAECPGTATAVSNCACKAEYFLSVDKTQCVQSIEEITCTPGEGGNTKCETQTQNTECHSSSSCVCKAEYYLSADKKTCVQKITTVDCIPGDADEGTSKCQNADTNSECPAESNNCVCKPGYKGTDSCAKVLMGECTESGDCTGTVENSECSSSTCSCEAGYKEENNICVKAQVSEIECDAGDEDCPVDNSECDDTENTPKCKCSHGYKKDSVDGTTCVNIPVLEIPCGSDTAACPVDNSECDRHETLPKCKCSHGFEVDSSDRISCVTMPVLEIPCGSDSASCPVDNSECDGHETLPKCKCSHGYKVDSNGGITCVSIPVLEIPCDSDAEDCPVDNSECDDEDTTPKCKCSDGYEEDSSDGSSCVKSAKSSATSAWMTTSVLVTSMLTYLPRLICWQIKV